MNERDILNGIVLKYYISIITISDLEMHIPKHQYKNFI